MLQVDTFVNYNKNELLEKPKKKIQKYKCHFLIRINGFCQIVKMLKNAYCKYLYGSTLSSPDLVDFKVTAQTVWVLYM